ncbi:hypothetical protein EV361DRAFT_870183 [Lentinula raphanica]|nr:hypothetical protein EV361DRAFT_870183 [Lentinula raphanica]
MHKSTLDVYPVHSVQPCTPSSTTLKTSPLATIKFVLDCSNTVQSLGQAISILVLQIVVMPHPASSSSLSSHTITIFLLTVCFVGVTAFVQPMNGTMTSKSLPATAVTLREHYSNQGNHTALLRFMGYEDFFWPVGNVQIDKLSWTPIGPAHFWDAEEVNKAFLQAKKYLAEQLQHYPIPHDDPVSNEMNKWRYTNDIMLSLSRYPAIDSKTMTSWTRKLPVFLTGTLTGGKAEEAYLWLGDLLISPTAIYSVPPMRLVEVPAEGRKFVSFSVGKIRNDISFDQVQKYVKSHSSLEFHGSHKDMKEWRKRKEEWREDYERIIKSRHSNKSLPGLLQNPTRSWEFKHRKFKICFSSCQPGPKEIAKIGPKTHFQSQLRLAQHYLPWILHFNNQAQTPTTHNTIFMCLSEKGLEIICCNRHDRHTCHA